MAPRDSTPTRVIYNPYIGLHSPNGDRVLTGVRYCFWTDTALSLCISTLSSECRCINDPYISGHHLWRHIAYRDYELCTSFILGRYHSVPLYKHHFV